MRVRLRVRPPRLPTVPRRPFPPSGAKTAWWYRLRTFLSFARCTVCPMSLALRSPGLRQRPPRLSSTQFPVPAVNRERPRPVLEGHGDHFFHHIPEAINVMSDGSSRTPPQNPEEQARTRRHFLRQAARHGLLGAGGIFLINDVRWGKLLDPLSPVRRLRSAAEDLDACTSGCDMIGGCVCNCNDINCTCNGACDYTCPCQCSCGCPCNCDSGCPCSCGCQCTCDCTCDCHCACTCACTCNPLSYQSDAAALFARNVDGNSKASATNNKRPTQNQFDKPRRDGQQRQVDRPDFDRQFHQRLRWQS